MVLKGVKLLWETSTGLAKALKYSQPYYLPNHSVCTKQKKQNYTIKRVLKAIKYTSHMRHFYKYFLALLSIFQLKPGYWKFFSLVVKVRSWNLHLILCSAYFHYSAGQLWWAILCLFKLKSCPWSMKMANIKVVLEASFIGLLFVNKWHNSIDKWWVYIPRSWESQTKKWSDLKYWIQKLNYNSY